MAEPGTSAAEPRLSKAEVSQTEASQAEAARGPVQAEPGHTQATSPEPVEWIDATTQELASIAPGGVSEHGGVRSTRKPRPVTPTRPTPSPSPATTTRPAMATRSATATRPATPVIEAHHEVAARFDLRELFRAARAGFEAMVLSWLIVVVPVIAGYVATVAAPVLGESSWVDAARNGTSIWLLGLGQGIDVPSLIDGQVATTRITLVPLCLTLLTLWLLRGAVRRAALTSLAGLGVAALTSLALVALAIAVNQTEVSAAGLALTLAVVAIGVASGSRLSDLQALLPDHPLVGAAIHGARSGWLALLGMLAVGLGVVVVSIVGSAAQIWQIHSALDPDAMSSFLMVAAQTAMVPTFAVWALSWLVGPGFAIGSVVVTAGAATTGPLPVLPVLAAVPAEGPGPGAWIVILPVAIGAIAMVRPLARSATWPEQAVLAGVAAAFVAAVGWILGALSGGQIGPLEHVGTEAAPLALALGGVTLIGAAIAWCAQWALQRAGVDLTSISVPSVRSLWSHARQLPRRARVTRGS